MKQKLKGGLEYDFICARHRYRYLINNPKLKRYIKRKINKRYRKSNKMIELAV